MIQATELRIGNWVQGSSDDVYQRPFQVSARDFSLADFMDNVRPTPITPKILMACGFLKTPWENVFIFKSYMYDIELERLCFDDDTSIGDCDIKYLHQLQNLYFALTGNELEYKQ